MRCAIDKALSQKPADLDSLFDLLQDAGWEIKRGKRISLRGPGQERFKRLDSLGEDYTEDALRAILSGKMERTPRKKTPKNSDERINLLLDIEAKLRSGKGPGYERWAKVFNLKQMAQTLNYLSEHNLLDYNALVFKTEAVTARYKELSEIIHSSQTRMDEIQTLRTHILNYLKTREVYASYRASGYSKVYLGEHEQEILLHKAAKQAFDKLGLKKLPTIKALQAEYTALLQKKKQAYAEYRQARDEMRQLLTAKANVDRLMSDHETDRQLSESHTR